MAIRKLVTVEEEIRLEGGRPAKRPHRMVAAAVVVTNPCAGRYVDDLAPLIDEYCDSLGELLAGMVVSRLGGDAVEAYGKGAVVGTAGEVEHASAVIHNLRFGNAFRTAVGEASTLLPSLEKRGLPGVVFDLPLKHVTDGATRSHHQTVELRVADAPQADEIVVVLAGATSGRPQERLAAFGTGTGEDAT
jgi:Amino acid synthesis